MFGFVLSVSVMCASISHSPPAESVGFEVVRSLGDSLTFSGLWDLTLFVDSQAINDTTKKVIGHEYNLKVILINERTLKDGKRTADGIFAVDRGEKELPPLGRSPDVYVMAVKDSVQIVLDPNTSHSAMMLRGLIEDDRISGTMRSDQYVGYVQGRFRMARSKDLRKYRWSSDGNLNRR